MMRREMTGEVTGTGAGTGTGITGAGTGPCGSGASSPSSSATAHPTSVGHVLVQEGSGPGDRYVGM